jgi:hypothetical protein
VNVVNETLIAVSVLIFFTYMPKSQI